MCFQACFHHVPTFAMIDAINAIMPMAALAGILGHAQQGVPPYTWRAIFVVYRFVEAQHDHPWGNA